MQDNEHSVRKKLSMPTARGLQTTCSQRCQRCSHVAAKLRRVDQTTRTLLAVAGRLLHLATSDTPNPTTAKYFQVFRFQWCCKDVRNCLRHGYDDAQNC
eukprot:4608709-Amphidinium_carterae.1